jgi:cyclophilin family peptidyl-prolyl cis-trans isomerase
MHFEFQVSGFTGFGLEQIASSKAGFNTNSSQFFITFEAWLATRECTDLYGFLCAQPPCDLNLNIVYIINPISLGHPCFLHPQRWQTHAETTFISRQFMIMAFAAILQA